MLTLAACLLLRASTLPHPACHTPPATVELHQVVPAARTHAWRT